MQRTRTLATWLTLVSFTLPLVGFFIPEPASSTRFGLDFDLYIYVAVTITLLFIAAAVLFMLGFEGFTAKLKRAYIFLSIGLVFHGLALFQIPLLTMTNQLESVWTRSGLITIPFMIALLSLFWGMRSFARLMGVKSIWTSMWFVQVLAIVIAIGSTFLPHFGEHSEEIAFDSSVAFSVWNLVIVLAIARLCLLIKQTANVTYANAMAWMFIAFTGLGITGLHYVVSILIFGDRSAYSESLAVLGTYIVSGMLYMRAAYAFNEIRSQSASTDTDRDFFGRPRTARPTTAATSIDIVVYTAQLASNPHEIDVIMDKMRSVTALMESKDSLSSKDTEVLKKVYLELEDYLINHEPVRTFTRESLRQDVQTKLQLDPQSDATFWSMLVKAK